MNVRPVTRTLDDRAPACPRCAYDLSVATQTWPEGACETHGRCTECGLRFEWGEVLNPQRQMPWWFFETKRSPLGTVRAGLVTALASLTPWYALRRTPMSLEPRVGRALALPVALFVLWYALGIFAAHLAVFLPASQVPSQPSWGRWSPPPPTSPELTTSLLWPFFESSQMASAHTQWWSRPIATFLPVVIFVHMLTSIASFLAMPATLRKFKVRKVHFVRLFSLCASGVTAVAIAVLFARIVLDALEYTGVATGYWNTIEDLLWWEVFGMAGTAFLLYLAWSLAFWWSACRWYLRLPSPFFHALTLWTLGTMLSSAILWVTWDRPADAIVEIFMWLI